MEPKAGVIMENKDAPRNPRMVGNQASWDLNHKTSIDCSCSAIVNTGLCECLELLHLLIKSDSILPIPRKKGKDEFSILPLQMLITLSSESPKSGGSYPISRKTLLTFAQGPGLLCL